jgi:hypothetical protein
MEGEISVLAQGFLVILGRAEGLRFTSGYSGGRGSGEL